MGVKISVKTIIGIILAIIMAVIVGGILFNTTGLLTSKDTQARTSYVSLSGTIIKVWQYEAGGLNPFDYKSMEKIDVNVPKEWYIQFNSSANALQLIDSEGVIVESRTLGDPLIKEVRCVEKFDDGATCSNKNGYLVFAKDKRVVTDNICVIKTGSSVAIYKSLGTCVEWW